MNSYKTITKESIPILVSLLFVYTATSKVYDWEGTRAALYNQVFPVWMAEGLLWGLPLLEIAVGGILLSNRWRAKGMWFSLLMMVGFSLYLGLVIMQVFDRVPCSCGGVFSGMGWELHLVVNLAIVSLIGFWLAKCRTPAARQSIEGLK
ncbi:hypothetical protein FKX85_06580 [Echinicola soli]|uniref:Methylamine utilisation protein MauE domain-containing protein n=1 Tax=Echinicola soli TaxID=2591634 RepID=A0A514CFY7_9BACT|nr:MauE/DoxX family redox-associated membrane protein [Echinicola soli]QDH78718.1 hypothetical protein FKX85_06580 [Echinicola soli]